MLVSEIINIGSNKLKDKNINSHLLDSELLLSKVLQLSREKILTNYNNFVKKDDINKFNILLKRRLKYEPMAYIFQKKEFFSKDFLVNNSTLIPRPETELLIEKIIENYKKKDIYILDIGTGSGFIILTLLNEMKKSKGIGIDISKKALDVAKMNARILKINKRLKFYKRSFNQIFGHKFDLIVSNPPYICTYDIKNLSNDIKNYEPRIALNGGNDGLDVIKKIIYKSTNILKRKGILALEIGYGQYRKISQILKLHGFKDKFLVKDYQNNIRCILATLENWFDKN